MKIKNIGEIKKSITEKNVPTDPEKWAYAKAQAKKKFDVYPSAYANGWASKKYKELGGSWRKEESVTEGDESSPEETLMGLKEMAKGDLERIGDYSKMILDRLNSGEELDSWMYSQITLAVDQLNSVHDAMDGNDGVVESIDEVDVNDPMMVKLRAAQMQRKADALKKAQPKKYTINPDWESGKNAKKIHILKKQRAQIMRDMEQEAEPSGGRIADKYGRMLDKIDKEIIKLGGNPMGESVNENTSTANILGIAFNITETDNGIFFSFKDKSQASNKVREIGSNKIINVIQNSLDKAFGKGEFFFKGGRHSEFQNGYLFQKNQSNIKLNKLKFEEDKSVNESNEPEIITQLRDVMKSGYKNIKDPKSGKNMKVDSFSASAIVKVYDALNDTNKQKFSSLGLIGMQNVAFKMIK